LRFPFPYKENFESYAPGKMARYFSDQNGTFVVAERADGRGKCLRQIGTVTVAPSWTIVGDKAWKDYEVSVDVHVPDKAYAAVCGRIDAALGRGMPGGYGLTLDSTGAWQLKDTTTVLQSGKVGLTPGAWHNLKLRFSGDQIIAAINGKTVCSVMDDFHLMGAVAVASNYHEVEFDNFTVMPFEGARPEPVAGWGNLALGKKTTASSQLGDDNSAAKATDGDHATGWSPQAGKTNGEWLEVDFGKDVTFDKTILDQHTISIGGYAGSITGYKIQYFDGAEWKDAVVGKTAATRQMDEFAAVTASKVRLLITACADKSCIYEFKVYRCGR
jgi:hypothetical protein